MLLKRLALMALIGGGMCAIVAAPMRSDGPVSAVQRKDDPSPCPDCSASDFPAVASTPERRLERPRAVNYTGCRKRETETHGFRSGQLVLASEWEIPSNPCELI